ncbi:hypothetical protein GGI00_005613 [Coemansia sp. RSA 2681]|nr:hypothetical protein GGI00_005613 [Coemansia sp. RSA 2681]KAJ2442782.1 hypothetical protein GGF42_006846 [Coemansia sp. RSA 2424]
MSSETNYSLLFCSADDWKTIVEAPQVAANQSAIYDWLYVNIVPSSDIDAASESLWTTVATFPWEAVVNFCILEV